MSGSSRHDLVTPMFRKLFNYISGKNEPNVRIDMTSPVTTLVVPGTGEGQGTFTMGFLVPVQHQADPPPSADRSIFIEDRPEMTVLTRQFGGYMDDEVEAKEARELAQIIRQNGEVGVDFERYYVVGYDPPFKLLGRRNEVWYIKSSASIMDGEGEGRGGREQVVANGNVVREEVEES